VTGDDGPKGGGVRGRMAVEGRTTYPPGGGPGDNTNVRIGRRNNGKEGKFLVASPWMPRVVLLGRRVCFLILLLAFRPVFGWDFYRRNNITLCLVRILQAPTHRSRVMFA